MLKYVISACKFSMKDRKCEEYEYKCDYKNMLPIRIKKYARQKVSEIKNAQPPIEKGILLEFF